VAAGTGMYCIGYRIEYAGVDGYCKAIAELTSTGFNCPAF